MKTEITTLVLGFMMVAGACAASVPEARTLGNEPLRFGNYEVHFSAFNSTFLAPEIARAYQLERGPRQGLVNIAVRNVKDSDAGTAISAKLEGHRQNLLQQQSGLKFQEIREGSAIYYLAGFRFSNEEMLEFNINVQPDGSDRTRKVQFRQQFYQDGK